jgi:hypothetical protein
MSALSFTVTDWFGDSLGNEDFTLGALCIVGEGCRPFTEVHDSVAMTTRDTIRAPASAVAEWLLTRWWRLRWEATPDAPGRSWRRAHSMAALGGGFAWPALEIACDGELVQLSLRREPCSDVAAIRYLNEIVNLEIPATEFEAAVDRFCDVVEARIASVSSRDNIVRELREELGQERTDPALACRCRREARAGIDPGDAPETWHAALEELARDAGDTAAEDLLSADGDCAVLSAAFERVKRGRIEIDLSDVPCAPVRDRMAKPWQRGATAARDARVRLGIPEGPVSDEVLGRILGVKLPVEPDGAPSCGIGGGYRVPDRLASTRVLVRSRRPESQRFYFARLLGLASAMPPTESLLPITDTHTALQKLGRSFAQEFLCPWDELEAFVDERGTGEGAIALAAERYRVSDLLVTSMLVNRGKIHRECLARFAS